MSNINAKTAALSNLSNLLGTARPKGDGTKSAAAKAKVEANRAERLARTLADLTAGKALNANEKNQKLSARQLVEKAIIALRAGALVEDILLTGAANRYPFANAASAIVELAVAAKVNPVDLLASLGCAPALQAELTAEAEVALPSEPVAEEPVAEEPVAEEVAEAPAEEPVAEPPVAKAKRRGRKHAA